MLCVVALAGLAGCATSFTGSAHIEDGRAGCERKCDGDGLAMTGFVYMGEYSTACVCGTRASGSDSANASAAASAAAVGVVMQMREEEQRNNDDVVVMSMTLQ
jgi:hypothetical protein